MTKNPRFVAFTSAVVSSACDFSCRTCSILPIAVPCRACGLLVLFLPCRTAASQDSLWWGAAATFRLPFLRGTDCDTVFLISSPMKVFVLRNRSNVQPEAWRNRYMPDTMRTAAIKRKGLALLSQLSMRAPTRCWSRAKEGHCQSEDACFRKT